MTIDPSESTPAPAKDPVAGKTVAEILGEIVWLMTQDPVGKEMKVSEIERLVMPAIMQRRFHIKYAKVPHARQQGAEALQPITADILSAPPASSEDVMLLARFSIIDNELNTTLAQ